MLMLRILDSGDVDYCSSDNYNLLINFTDTAK